MPRQSHAKKAIHLFQELVADVQTIFTGLADRPDLKNLATDIRQTGAEIGDIMKTAGEGVKTAFKQAQNEATMLMQSAEEKVRQKLSVLAQKVQDDSAEAQPEPGAWTAESDMVYATAEPADPATQPCVLTGVHPDGMLFAG